MNYRPLKFFAIAASSLAATLAICFGIMAWSEPGATPPGGNVAAPINTGSTLQNKVGDLLIGAGLKISSLGTAFALKTNDAQETPRLVVGQDGNVGIGTTGPEKKLEVAGDTKSSRFCLGAKCCATWEECFGNTPSCVPATCASLGKNCGSWPDGCGATLSCDSCSSGYTCTSGICVAESGGGCPTTRPKCSCPPGYVDKINDISGSFCNAVSVTCSVPVTVCCPGSPCYTIPASGITNQMNICYTGIGNGVCTLN